MRKGKMTADQIQSRLGGQQGRPAAASANDDDPIGIFLMAFLACVALGVLWLFLTRPYTYTASAVFIGETAVEQSSKAGESEDEDGTEAPLQRGADFSSILRAPQNETTQAMQSIAIQCMNGKPRKFAAGNDIYDAYEQSTKYLLCAMRQDVERLCHADERTRLAQQLEQYKDRLQHVLGMQRMREKLLKSPHARTATTLKRWKNGSDPSVDYVAKTYDENIDPSILQEIATLNRAGYLTANDFSFMGFMIPAEYAPALHLDEAGDPPPC